MVVLIKYSGSIIVSPLSIDINPTTFRVSFILGNSNNYLSANTETSTMLAPGKLLAIGCATCNNGEGQIFFYDTYNMNKTLTLKGDR